jgi:hypothetical protein
LAIDGPSEHRAAVGVLDEASELGGVAGVQFTGCDRFIKQPFCFDPDRLELLERDGVEVRIRQIVLQPGKPVGHGFGGGCKGSAIGVNLDESFQRRFVLGTRGRELLRNAAGPGVRQRKEQATLGAETLNERRGDDSGFFGDVGEGELRRTAALHDARGSGKDLMVRSFAWARHFKATSAAARITEWLFTFHLTFLNDCS